MDGNDCLENNNEVIGKEDNGCNVRRVGLIYNLKSIKKIIESTNFRRDRESELKMIEELVSVESKSHWIIDTMECPPNEDLQRIYKELDNKYFSGVLQRNGTVVKWTNRMFVSAGVTYEAFGNEPVEIRISAKIMSLRPHLDLIETLLHEMIHAFLFFTHKDYAKEEAEFKGHGKLFCSLMEEINRKGNFGISIYHEFDKEVCYYQHLRNVRKLKIKAQRLAIKVKQ